MPDFRLLGNVERLLIDTGAFSPRDSDEEYRCSTVWETCSCDFLQREQARLEQLVGQLNLSQNWGIIPDVWDELNAGNIKLSVLQEEEKDTLKAGKLSELQKYRAETLMRALSKSVVRVYNRDVEQFVANIEDAVYRNYRRRIGFSKNETDPTLIACALASARSARTGVFSHDKKLVATLQDCLGTARIQNYGPFKPISVYYESGCQIVQVPLKKFIERYTDSKYRGSLARAS